MKKEAHFTLHRSAKIPNPWIVRLRIGEGQIFERETNEIDRGAAERVAERFVEQLREADLAQAERAARGEDVTAGGLLREHFRETGLSECSDNEAGGGLATGGAPRTSPVGSGRAGTHR